MEKISIPVKHKVKRGQVLCKFPQNTRPHVAEFSDISTLVHAFADAVCDYITKAFSDLILIIHFLVIEGPIIGISIKAICYVKLLCLRSCLENVIQEFRQIIRFSLHSIVCITGAITDCLRSNPDKMFLQISFEILHCSILY